MIPRGYNSDMKMLQSQIYNIVLIRTTDAEYIHPGEMVHVHNELNHFYFPFLSPPSFLLQNSDALPFYKISVFFAYYLTPTCSLNYLYFWFVI